MSDQDAGRKVKGGSTIVRQGDPGRSSGKGKGKIVFTAPAPVPDGPTEEQVAAVERAGGRVKKAARAKVEEVPVDAAEVVAEPAGE